MTGRGAPKKELDPEELMRRKFRAKCLFRALGRLVMANAYWLIEASDHYEGDDVKRRVEQAVRGKTKKKQLLGINVFKTPYDALYIYTTAQGLSVAIAWK